VQIEIAERIAAVQLGGGRLGIAHLRAEVDGRVVVDDAHAGPHRGRLGVVGIVLREVGELRSLLPGRIWIVLVGRFSSTSQIVNAFGVRRLAAALARRQLAADGFIEGGRGGCATAQSSGWVHADD
jgi:hypothetical protein